MSLVDILFDANHPDRDIVIVESLPKNPKAAIEYEEKRQKVEEGFRTIFGRSTRVNVIQPNMARIMGGLENSAVLLNSGNGSLLPDPKRISSVVKLAYEINQDNPNSRIAVTVNHYDAKPMSQVSWVQFAYMDREPSSYDKVILMDE